MRPAPSGQSAGVRCWEHWYKRHWKTEIVVNSLEMLSSRGKKEYAKKA